MVRDMMRDPRTDCMVPAYPPKFTRHYKEVRIEHEHGSLGFAVGPRIADLYYENVHHDRYPITKDEMLEVAKRIIDQHPEWIKQAKGSDTSEKIFWHGESTAKTPKAKKPTPEAVPQVQRVFVTGDAHRLTRDGVEWLTNVRQTVGRFKSWDDASKGSGGLHQHRIYQGVPFTQDELGTYYPELKQYTGLTKAKIGSGKVLFKDLKTPIAIEYRGKVFLVASFTPPPIKAAWIQQPQSAAPPLTSDELLTRARELGKEAYGVGWHDHTRDLTLSVLCHNPEQEPAMVVNMIAAWKKGWQAAQKTTPTPNLPPILTAPPELTADVLGVGPTPAAAPKTRTPTAKPHPKWVKVESVTKVECVNPLHNLKDNTTHFWVNGYTEAHKYTVKGDAANALMDLFDVKNLISRGMIEAERKQEVNAQLNQLAQNIIDKLAGKAPTPKTAAPKPKKQPVARKPAPTLPPILTAPPELAADLLGGLTPTPAAPKRKKQPAKRKPAPDMPSILTAPPELAADVLGTGPMGLPPTTAPKHKPAARTTKPKAKKTPAAQPRKTTKKTAKPKTKKTAAAPKLTASQREYLAIQGFVMVKRGGKYVRITN